MIDDPDSPLKVNPKLRPMTTLSPLNRNDNKRKIKIMSPKNVVTQSLEVTSIRYSIKDSQNLGLFMK